jgi:hypothetical protein
MADAIRSRAAVAAIFRSLSSDRKLTQVKRISDALSDSSIGASRGSSPCPSTSTCQTLAQGFEDFVPASISLDAVIELAS